MRVHARLFLQRAKRLTFLPLKYSKGRAPKNMRAPNVPNVLRSRRLPWNHQYQISLNKIDTIAFNENSRHCNASTACLIPRTRVPKAACLFRARDSDLGLKELPLHRLTSADTARLRISPARSVVPPRHLVCISIQGKRARDRRLS